MVNIIAVGTASCGLFSENEAYRFKEAGYIYFYINMVFANMIYAFSFKSLYTQAQKWCTDQKRLYWSL